MRGSLCGGPAKPAAAQLAPAAHELLRKKAKRDAYNAFPELYRDIRITALPEEKTGLRQRLRGAWQRNRDVLFRVLLRVCAVVAVLALVILISQLIFGDFPLLRLFQNTFETIGTEDLTKT